MKKIETFLQKYFGFITLGAYALFAIFALGRGTAASINRFNHTTTFSGFFRLSDCFLVPYTGLGDVIPGLFIMFLTLSGSVSLLFYLFYLVFSFCMERSSILLITIYFLLRKGTPTLSNIPSPSRLILIQPSLPLDISLLFSSLFLLPLLFLFLSIRSKAVSVTRITRSSV